MEEKPPLKAVAVTVTSNITPDFNQQLEMELNESLNAEFAQQLGQQELRACLQVAVDGGSQWGRICCGELGVGLVKVQVQGSLLQNDKVYRTICQTVANESDSAVLGCGDMCWLCHPRGKCCADAGPSLARQIALRQCSQSIRTALAQVPQGMS
jgi:hypothetical protein|uniref:Uncharacterized protein n=1 Tax=Eutreptiella gymnastica TaxID=73025 RepID=A0A7S4GEK6_9EUGL